MHQTVLLREAVEALVTTSDGTYVDGTFGRGGHSRAVLQRLSSHGHLLGVDKDPAAAAVAAQLSATDSRFSFFHGSFAELPTELASRGITGLDGILLDLGVSSPQLDDSERGFSFQHDGPLDMRMDTSSGETAAQWLARATEQDIATVLKEYGEERFARRIAGAIVSARAEAPIVTTGRLAKSSVRPIRAGRSTSIRRRARSRVFASSSTASWMIWLHCWRRPWACSKWAAAWW